MSSLCVHPFYLKFKIWRWFLYCISFWKVLNKNSLLKCSWRAYYAPLAVLRYIYDFGGLEGLCTSILNPLYFLSEIQYGRCTERHLDVRLLDQKFLVNSKNWPSLHCYISVNTKSKYLMKWYTGRVEIFQSNVIGIDVRYEGWSRAGNSNILAICQLVFFAKFPTSCIAYNS